MWGVVFHHLPIHVSQANINSEYYTGWLSHWGEPVANTSSLQVRAAHTGGMRERDSRRINLPVWACRLRQAFPLSWRPTAHSLFIWRTGEPISASATAQTATGTCVMVVEVVEVVVMEVEGCGLTRARGNSILLPLSCFAATRCTRA